MKAKRILSLLLVAIILYVTTPTAYAATYFETNTEEWHYRYYFGGYIELCYHHYRTAENVVIPSKIGAVPVVGFCEGNEYFYTVMLADEKIKSITFELQVTHLPESFAANCLSLESVTLPESLLSLPEKAFYNCVNLSSINIPKGLKSIGAGAFLYCKALKSVTLPSSLQTIEGSAFNSCSALKTVTLPSSLRRLGDSAFANCTAIESVVINDGLQQIGACAFSLCSSLGSIELPETVTSVGTEAFRNCRGLKSAVLPEGLTVIPTGLFRDCLALETVNIPSTVYCIQGSAFRSCRSLDGVTLPTGLRTLQDSAFNDCRSLSSITIPGSVSNIAAGAFYGCTGLKNVTVQHGVRSIGEHAEGYEGESTLGRTFANCSPDLKITLPTSVITVCKDSFDGVRKKYLDGEKRFLDRIDFAFADDKTGFKYRVPISFRTDHGEAPDTLWPYVGDEYQLPNITAKGYSFVGWLFNGEGDHHTGTFTTGTEGIEMVAKWNVNTNTVTFVNRIVFSDERVTVLSGDCVPEPDTKVLGDKYIAGWSTADGDLYDFNKPVYESFNLYAEWSIAPRIDVNITGLDPDRDNRVVFCESPDDPSGADNIYAVFYTSGSASVPVGAKMVIYAGDGVVYSGAVTADIPIGNEGACYSRTTDIINGTAYYKLDYGIHATVNVDFSAAPKLTVNALSDEYVTGSGETGTLNTEELWLLQDGANPRNSLARGDTINVPQGEIMPASARLTLTLTVPNGFGCDGTIINGNSTIPVYDGKTVYEFDPQGSVTLNLHWYNRENYVTLTFLNTNNTEQFFTQKYPKGDNAPDSFEVPDCPYSHSAGVFDHWTARIDGADVNYCIGEIPSLPQEDTVFSTVWKDVRFISFNKNRAQAKGVMRKQAANFLDNQNNQPRYFTVVPPCGFTCDGYVFTGWDTKSGGNGTGYQPGDTITITNSTTLYAQWEKANTVFLYPNFDGGECVRQEIIQNGSAALLTPFTRDGYMFAGWTTSADGNGDYYAPGETVSPDANMTLYAQWHAHEWEFDSFVWATDNKTAQVKLVCAEDSAHVTCVNAEVNAYPKAASCTADADTVYEAVYGEHIETRTVTEANTALGHSYGEPEWTWTEILTKSEDPAESGLSYNPKRYSATVAFSCVRGDDTQTLTAEVTDEVTSEPTAAEPGERTYTAAVTFNGTAYTNTKTETIPALGLPANESVEALINAIGEVVYTDDCHNTIVLARAVYDSLTDNEKALVTNYETLTSAEEQYAFLESLRPKVTNHMLVLSGEIGVMFRVHFPANFDPTNCRMDFAVEDGRTSSMAYADAKTIEGSDDRYFTCYINALELADNITATLTFGDGETRTDSFSAMTYIEYVQENMTDNTKLLDLVNALQDYGYYLQNSTWTDGTDHTRITAPVNELTYERMETAAQDVMFYGFMSNLGESGIESVLLSLTLNAETRINVFVKPRDGVTITTPGSIQTTIDGETYYQFQSLKLGAGALGDTRSFNIETNAGKAALVVASAMSYVRIVLNSYGYHTEFANNDKNAMAALYYYFKCANAYQKAN